MSQTTRGQTGILILAGALGVLGALAFFPRAHTTVATQVGVAMLRPPEWLPTAAARPRPALERFASASAGDAELQAALATLPPGKPTEEVLSQLAAVALRFPNDAAVRAHQLRLMTQTAIWLRRPEEHWLGGQPAPKEDRKLVPPSSLALEEFDRIAAEGQRLEPENGYFDAMRAAGAFAARRDAEALGYLHEAAWKPKWDDHAVEGTRAQWRLLRQAYGDGGSLQRHLSATALQLLHFSTLRSTARVALWHAAQREKAGDAVGGRAIRNDIMRLGARITDGSPLLMGKLVGQAIFQIAFNPVPRQPWPQIALARPDPITGQRFRSPTPEEIEELRAQRRERYATELAAMGDAEGAAWVRETSERMQAFEARCRQALDEAQESATRAMMGFAAWWTCGLLLLWQLIPLALLWGIGQLLSRRSSIVGAARRQPEGAARIAELGAWHGVGLLLLLTPTFLLLPWWGTADAEMLFYVGLLAGMLLLGALTLAWDAGRKRRRAPVEVADVTERPTRWQPALVACLAVLPMMACLLAIGATLQRVLGETPTGWVAFLSGPLVPLGVVMRSFYVFQPMLGLEPAPNPGALVATLALLPALLVAYLVLLRVAACDLTLRAGMARGLCRTAPIALAMLAALYLVSIPFTVAADHSVDARLEQMVTDEAALLR
jgi:hypothetical protein